MSDEGVVSGEGLDPATRQARALGAIFCAVWPSETGPDDRTLEQTVDRVRQIIDDLNSWRREAQGYHELEKTRAEENRRVEAANLRTLEEYRQRAIENAEAARSMRAELDTVRARLAALARAAYDYGHTDGSSGCAHATDEELRAWLAERQEGRGENMTKCPTCGEARLVADVCDERIEVADVRFMAKVPCERCPACGETLVTSEVLERFEVTVAVELARLGRRTGSALRFMRKALRLQALEAARMLSVRPETWSRWETGERAPDASVFALVGALAADRLEGHGPRVAPEPLSATYPGAAPARPSHEEPTTDPLTRHREQREEAAWRRERADLELVAVVEDVLDAVAGGMMPAKTEAT